MSRTSAKGNFVPKRKYVNCPICDKRISVNPSEYRKIQKGTRGPCCSISCGQKYRRIKKEVE